MHFPDTGFTIGNCQIQFHTSGESAEEKDPIIINPKDIRDMAGWVLDKCVLEEELGGFVTKNLANAVDWLLDLKSELEHRYRVLEDAIGHMERDSDQRNPYDWWTPPRHQKLALNSSVLTLSNASSLRRLSSRNDDRARLTET